MAKLVFDAQGTRNFETGVSECVLFPMSTTPGTYDTGVAWNGITKVSESPEGGEVSPVYADNIKYLNLMSAEEFKANIEAYTYPDEFAACDGSLEVSKGTGMFVTQQTRKLFGLCYKTKIGNDLNPELGFKLHIIYNCLAAPSERSYETVNDSPEAMTFSWDISTTPVEVTGFKPTAHIEIDSTKANPAKLKTLLETLYGSDSGIKNPTLPTPDAIVAMLKPEGSSLSLGGDDNNVGGGIGGRTRDGVGGSN